MFQRETLPPITAGSDLAAEAARNDRIEPWRRSRSSNEERAYRDRRPTERIRGQIPIPPGRVASNDVSRPTAALRLHGCRVDGKERRRPPPHPLIERGGSVRDEPIRAGRVARNERIETNTPALRRSSSEARAYRDPSSPAGLVPLPPETLECQRPARTQVRRHPPTARPWRLR